jgi:hypothetical protein
LPVLVLVLVLVAVLVLVRHLDGSFAGVFDVAQ